MSSKYEEKINNIVVMLARVDERTQAIPIIQKHLEKLNNRVGATEKDITEIKTTESGKLRIPLKVWLLLLVILLGGTGGSSAIITKLLEVW